MIKIIALSLSAKSKILSIDEITERIGHPPDSTKIKGDPISKTGYAKKTNLSLNEYNIWSRDFASAGSFFGENLHIVSAFVKKQNLLSDEHISYHLMATIDVEDAVGSIELFSEDMFTLGGAGILVWIDIYSDTSDARSGDTNRL